MIYLLSSIYVATTGMIVPPLIQWCQVSLPAGLVVNRDCSRLGIPSASYDDLLVLIVWVRDSTCPPVEDKLLNLYI